MGRVIMLDRVHRVLDARLPGNNSATIQISGAKDLLAQCPQLPAGLKAIQFSLFFIPVEEGEFKFKLEGQGQASGQPFELYGEVLEGQANYASSTAGFVGVGPSGQLNCTYQGMASRAILDVFAYTF